MKRGVQIFKYITFKAIPDNSPFSNLIKYFNE